MIKTVNEELRQSRLKICKSCENFVTKIKICSKCGCYVPAKVTFAESHCPEMKWEKSTAGTSLINKLEELILDSWNRN
jgi:hypothetical protein